jgi:GxxExxY protein
MAVHRELGPGLLESIYEDSLAWEMLKKGITFSRQHAVPVWYDGHQVGDPLRVDFLVENLLVVEIKAVETLHPVFTAQVLSYLKLLGKPLGLLVNFHSVLMKDGVHRLMIPGYAGGGHRAIGGNGGNGELPRRTEANGG